MKSRLLALCIGSGLLLAAAPRQRTQSNDMRRAIEWEHYKDMAAARQARREARHPSVTYRGEANREDEHAVRQGQRVVDPGPPAWRKDQRNKDQRDRQ